MRRKKPKRSKPPEATVSGVLGLGLDGDDGHYRQTRTEEMVLVGGSAETHEKMQETAIRFGEPGEAGQDAPGDAGRERKSCG